jgi:hypothetical protein
MGRESIMIIASHTIHANVFSDVKKDILKVINNLVLKNLGIRRPLNYFEFVNLVSLSRSNGSSMEETTTPISYTH